MKMEAIQKYILLFLCMHIFISCVKDDDWVPPDPPAGTDTVSIRFRVRTAPTTYALSEDAENDLETVDILAFKENGNNELYYAYHVEGTDIVDLSSSQKEFKAKVRNDSLYYQFVILANARADIEGLGSISTATTKSEVLSYLLSRNPDKWNTAPAAYRAIPMWGETGILKIGERGVIDNLFLLRGLARIDVLVAANMESQFKLEKVYIYNRKTRGHLAPRSDFWDPVLKKVTAPTMPEDIYPLDPLTIKGPIWYDSESTTEFVRNVYLYEAAGGGPDERLDATCLVVGGYYGTETTLSYYRVDLMNDAQTGYRDILRNHLYEIRIVSVSASGYDTPDAAFEGRSKNMQVVITTWNLSTMEIIIEATYSLKITPSVFLLQDSEAYLLVSTIRTTYPGGWSFSIDPQSEAEGFNASQVGDELWIEVPGGTSTGAFYINVMAGNLYAFIMVERSIN